MGVAQTIPIELEAMSVAPKVVQELNKSEEEQ